MYKVNKYGPGYYISTMLKGEIFDIAYLDPYSCPTIKEVKANAKLIAAAPDMIFALKIMLERFGDIEGYGESLDSIAINKARRAIKKALGL